MEQKYGQFLNGMAKFERMLQDPQPQYSKMVTKYWFLLLRQSEELGLGMYSYEQKLLRKLKGRMMTVFEWSYHPLYNPKGKRDEKSDDLDKRFKTGDYMTWKFPHTPLGGR